ncbi:MAG: GNAT family N-acetyltransferase [Actinomycetes bacterium]
MMPPVPAGTPAAATLVVPVRIQRGVAASESEWARLFHDTFGAKLTFWPVLPRDRARAKALVAACVARDSVYVAVDADDQVVGVALAGARLLRPDRAALRAAYGPVGGACRLAALRLLAAAPDKRGVVHLDGFTVAPKVRGGGIGSAMLERVIADARSQGVRAIELVVGDLSPARRLYHRFGFRDTGSTPTGPFRRRIGYAHLTRMRLDIAQSGEEIT